MWGIFWTKISITLSQTHYESREIGRGIQILSREVILKRLPLFLFSLNFPTFFFLCLFILFRVRNSAETISLYKSENTEKKELNSDLQKLLNNQKQLATGHLWLGIFTKMFDYSGNNLLF